MTNDNDQMTLASRGRSLIISSQEDLASFRNCVCVHVVMCACMCVEKRTTLELVPTFHPSTFTRMLIWNSG